MPSRQPLAAPVRHQLGLRTVESLGHQYRRLVGTAPTSYRRAATRIREITDHPEARSPFASVRACAVRQVELITLPKAFPDRRDV